MPSTYHTPVIDKFLRYLWYDLCIYKMRIRTAYTLTRDCEDSMNDTLIIVLSHSKHLILESILQKCTQSYMSKDVSRNIDCNSVQPETTKMSIHRGITK